MGTWFKQPREVREVHEHETPTCVLRNEDIEVGDRFHCKCGTIFEVIDKQDALVNDDPQGGWNLVWGTVWEPPAADLQENIEPTPLDPLPKDPKDPK